MKILITGGAGFIGSNFIGEALRFGHEIINIDKLTYSGNLSNLIDAMKSPNYCFYREDICNSKAISKIIFNHKPDTILHMAAESHVDRSIKCANVFIQTNINGTYSLLNSALEYYKSLVNKSDFRFIHLSTDEVFGTLGVEGQFDETMPYRPNSPYAASKASSDLLVRAFYKTHCFPAIIVNSSNNYGPKQYPEKLIPLMILNALQKKVLPIYGEGKQIRDWIHVQDHVNALFLIIKSGKIGESYCVGSNFECENLDLVTDICNILNELKPINKPYSDLISFIPDRLGHDFRYATDSSKLSLHTGWKPTINLKEGLRSTIKWYLEFFNTLFIQKKLHKKVEIKSSL
jgi:dTDP-glucose 4,6-dehydratase